MAIGISTFLILVNTVESTISEPADTTSLSDRIAKSILKTGQRPSSTLPTREWNRWHQQYQLSPLIKFAVPEASTVPVALAVPVSSAILITSPDPVSASPVASAVVIVSTDSIAELIVSSV